MFYLTRQQVPILIVNLLAMIAFGVWFVISDNTEFIGYIAVIIILGGAILASNKKIEYPIGLLWGLTAWSILHMAGGGLSWNGVGFYDIMLLPLTENILRYDQVVHAFGFYVATYIAFLLLQLSLSRPIKRWLPLCIVLAMAGMGFGALNEIIEFGVTLVVEDHGVGGYLNTALDLVANGIGSVTASIVIYFTYRNKKGWGS